MKKAALEMGIKKEGKCSEKLTGAFKLRCN